MTLAEAMDALQAKSDPKTKAQNLKRGAPENQFGCKMGDIRTLAKSIKSDHALALELWKTGNLDARLLAILILKPKDLTPQDLEEITKSIDYAWLADWFNSYVVKSHPAKEQLREPWMDSSDQWLRRAGWSLTTERISKSPDGLDLAALLDRIEREAPDAPEPAQWTMNFALAETGIKYPEHRARALEIGEKLGLYRDYPVSKGCVSPFAPIWINEMVSRQK